MQHVECARSSSYQHQRFSPNWIRALQVDQSLRRCFDIQCCFIIKRLSGEVCVGRHDRSEEEDTEFEEYLALS